MAPGLLPFVLWAFPHRDPISPTFYGLTLLLAFGLAGAIYTGYRRIERRGEQGQRLAAVAGYAGCVLACLLIFPGDVEIGLTVLALLAFGDGSATLFGKLLGGPKLPWNRDKTLAGLAAFICLGGLTASFVYWGESNNLEAAHVPVQFPTAMLIGGVAALCAAVAESVPSRINDNIRVGVTAILAVTLLHALVVGIS